MKHPFNVEKFLLDIELAGGSLVVFDGDDNYSAETIDYAIRNKLVKEFFGGGFACWSTYSFRDPNKPSVAKRIIDFLVRN